MTPAPTVAGGHKVEAWEFGSAGSPGQSSWVGSLPRVHDAEGQHAGPNPENITARKCIGTTGDAPAVSVRSPECGKAALRKGRSPNYAPPDTLSEARSRGPTLRSRLAG